MRPARREPSAIHQSVLPREVEELLALEPGQCVVDATVGAGGHSRQILSRIRPGGFLIGIDRDPMMLELAAEQLGPSQGTSVTGTPIDAESVSDTGQSGRGQIACGGPAEDVLLKHASYVELPGILAELQIAGVDRVLADLGLSSDQLADSGRGFSFDTEGPLDLRFDPSAGETAAQRLQRLSADELSRLFQEFGEEPFSKRIADAIVQHRRRAPLRTARELAEVVAGAVPPRREKGKHPATRVFQALRIAVNDELQHVSELIDVVLPQILVPGGRAAIITFHSLEDRLVKRAFRDKSRWEPVTAKPVTASSVERRQNPRSRSAKLRVAVRVVCQS